MEQADFAALSLYTGPSNVCHLINESSSWIDGQWDGINADLSEKELKKDLDHRIGVVLTAFKMILPKFKTKDRHFVIPEFFFRCRQGPYPYIKIEGQYPFGYLVSSLKEELKKCIGEDDNNYTVIAGSTLTSNQDDYLTFMNSNPVVNRLGNLNEILNQREALNALKNHPRKTPFKKIRYKPWERFVKVEHSSNKSINELNAFMIRSRKNPLCTVRNRGAYFHFNKNLPNGVEVFIYEKQSESTIDLTMGILDFSQNNRVEINPNGMITEWLSNYPSHLGINGDKQTTVDSTNARFSPSSYMDRDVGVEICLDHRFQRLRRTVDMSVQNGADVDNLPIAKQFIPSGSMQILDYAIAAHGDSVIFNADGVARLLVHHKPSKYLNEGKPGHHKGIIRNVYSHSIQSRWTEGVNTYYSHSQLAFTTKDSNIVGFNNALGINNPKVSTFNGTVDKPYNERTDSYHPLAIPIKIDKGLFAHDEGEIHYYGPK